jgi:hypothetical protein
MLPGLGGGLGGHSSLQLEGGGGGDVASLYTRMRVNSMELSVCTRELPTSRGASINWQAGINQMRRSSGKSIWAGRCGNRSAAVDHRTSRIYLSTPPTLDGDSAHSALTPAIASIPRSYPPTWSAAVSVSSTHTPMCAHTRSSIHSPRTFT